MLLQGSSVVATLHEEFEGLCTMPLDVLVSAASMPRCLVGVCLCMAHAFRQPSPEFAHVCAAHDSAMPPRTCQSQPALGLSADRAAVSQVGK